MAMFIAIIWMRQEKVVVHVPDMVPLFRTALLIFKKGNGSCILYNEFTPDAIYGVFTVRSI